MEEGKDLAAPSRIAALSLSRPSPPPSPTPQGAMLTRPEDGGDLPTGDVDGFECSSGGSAMCNKSWERGEGWLLGEYGLERDFFPLFVSDA